jgi:hypothetical protein
MKVILISILLISLAFIGLGVSIFFRKGGRFPEIEIGRNKNMRKLGIYCVKCEENKIFRKTNQRQFEKIKLPELKMDLSKLRQTL